MTFHSGWDTDAGAQLLCEYTVRDSIPPSRVLVAGRNGGYPVTVSQKEGRVCYSASHSGVEGK